MKQRVAVTVFSGMVCPRLDTADGIWLYEIENGSVRDCSLFKADLEHPVRMAEFLEQKEIDVVICGGCPRYYLQVLVCFGLTVFTGLEGTPGQVIRRYVSGELPAPLHAGKVYAEVGHGCQCRHGQKRHGQNRKNTKKN